MFNFKCNISITYHVFKYFCHVYLDDKDETFATGDNNLCPSAIIKKFEAPSTLNVQQKVKKDEAIKYFDQLASYNAFQTDRPIPLRNFVFGGPGIGTQLFSNILKIILS